MAWLEYPTGIKGLSSDHELFQHNCCKLLQMIRYSHQWKVTRHVTLPRISYGSFLDVLHAVTVKLFLGIVVELQLVVPTVNIHW